uniref:hypothetical protein n=1 Tax=Candidatus Ventrenecus sp. TaxID=3085654 RepID=UPI003FF02E31
MNGLNKTEIKRDELNLQLRELITIIDFIDGNKKDYKNYVEGTLNEEAYLDEQIKLTIEAKNRLLAIFKD